MQDKKYIIYKVTNRFDNKIYIGAHLTHDINDRYMGSGVEIREALKKFGRKSFIKEILFEFNTRAEMLAKEKEIVTREFCMRDDTYNRIEGGGTYVIEGMLPVRDENGKVMLVYREDPRYLSGELVQMHKGLPMDKIKGKVNVRDKDGNCFQVSINDERYLSGELVHASKGISKNNGWTGRAHDSASIEKMRAKAKERIGIKNSQFGTCWVTNGVDSKKIKNEQIEEYLSIGYKKGRTLNGKNCN